MNSREEIGAAIQALRKAAGLSQQQVAEAAGLTRSSIANIEGGRQGVPIETLARIAAVLGTTVSALLGEAPAPSASLSLLTKVTGRQCEITKLMTEVADVMVGLAAASERLEKLLEDAQQAQGRRDKDR